MPAFADAAESARTDTAQTLEEVVVTAERRTSDVQRTPASVSVRAGEDLTAQGKFSTRQILEDVPGLVVVDNNSLNVGSADVQGNNITIRGITPGTSAGGGPSQISATPGAAVYVDGVYEGVGGNYDIERVEVLRGPQGTLYGRSATTGVVAFRTRNPTMDGFSADLGAEFGNYDLQHYTGGANIPLADGLAARISADYRDQGEGYFDQASRGMIKRTQARVKLLWEPTDALSILGGFAYDKNESFSGGKSRTVAPPTLAVTTRTTNVFSGLKNQRQYWAEANWDIGPVTLTYLPAYRTWEQNDRLFTSANFIGSGAGQNQLIKTPKDDFHTEELRISSKEGAKIHWLAGAFYYHNTLETTNRNYLITPSAGELAVLSNASDQKETEAFGVFAETTIPLSDSLRLTLGARYDKTEVVVSETLYDNVYALCGTTSQFTVKLPPGAVCTGPGQASVASPGAVSIKGVKLNYNNFNYKARLEYDLTPVNMLYGMISTGFRPGDAGISNRLPNVLDAEKLTSIEVGSKNRLFNNSLQVNAALYYYNYDGYQTSYRPDTPSPTDYTGINTTVRTTVPARNIGGEIEVLYQITPQDRVGLDYNYVESRWHDKPAGFAAAQTEKKRALTPYTLNANYEHRFTLPGGSTFSARIDGRYEAGHLERDLHVDLLRIGFAKYVYVDARTVGNLTGAWVSSGGDYSVSAYVRNFTDEKYATNDVRGDTKSFTVNWTDPRTFGVVLSAKF